MGRAMKSGLRFEEWVVRWEKRKKRGSRNEKKGCAMETGLRFEEWVVQWKKRKKHGWRDEKKVARWKVDCAMESGLRYGEWVVRWKNVVPFFSISEPDLIRFFLSPGSLQLRWGGGAC